VDIGRRHSPIGPRPSIRAQPVRSPAVHRIRRSLVCRGGPGPRPGTDVELSDAEHRGACRVDPRHLLPANRRSLREAGPRTLTGIPRTVPRASEKCTSPSPRSPCGPPGHKATLIASSGSSASSPWARTAAMGATLYANGARTLMERWLHRRWHLVRSPNPGVSQRGRRGGSTSYPEGVRLVHMPPPRVDLGGQGFHVRL
jgi:hypothetical protein